MEDPTVSVADLDRKFHDNHSRPIGEVEFRQKLITLRGESREFANAVDS